MATHHPAGTPQMTAVVAGHRAGVLRIQAVNGNAAVAEEEPLTPVPTWSVGGCQAALQQAVQLFGERPVVFPLAQLAGLLVFP